MGELRGVVLRLKRMGLRTEPCGIPEVRGGEGERCGGMATADVRDNKCEVNHWKKREDKPNQLERDDDVR